MNIVTAEVTPEKVREELPRLLSLLPPWRREKALAFRCDKDRYLCAKSFLMLQKTAAAEFGLAAIPPFAYGANGKPYWREYPQFHFNLSHCDAGIACAVGREPVGIDVERIFFDRELAEAVLAPAELAEVLNAAAPAQRFATYWTCKESLIKLTGTGIDDDLKSVLLRHGNAVAFTTRPAGPGCIATAAVWKNGVQPVYC